MQEAHGVNGLDGLQDLLPQAQRGAHGEGPAGLAPPQVSQVAALHTNKLLATSAGAARASKRDPDPPFFSDCTRHNETPLLPIN